jgi:AcrR family transcriptional regulator
MAVAALTTSVATAVAEGARPAADPPSARVLAATITCLGRWGLTKTTLDDIAREAGLSRATVYRLFPGGKDVVVRAAVASEVDALQRGLATGLAGCETLEDVLVGTITYVTRTLAEHAVLQFLLEHEPDQVLPHLAFGRFDQLLDAAAAMTLPWLAPHLGPELAARGGEWVARLVLSYALAPSEWFDLGDDCDARRFTRTFLLPGLVRKASHHG